MKRAHLARALHHLGSGPRPEGFDASVFVDVHEGLAGPLGPVPPHPRLPNLPGVEWKRSDVFGLEEEYGQDDTGRGNDKGREGENAPVRSRREKKLDVNVVTHV